MATPRNSLVNKINTNIFVKIIHVFNSLKHGCHIQIVYAIDKNLQKWTIDFQSIVVEGTDNFQDQFMAWRLNIIFEGLLVQIFLVQSVFETQCALLQERYTL